MRVTELASEKDFTELTDTANRIFTGKWDNAHFTYNEHFFQKVMPKLYQDPSTAKEHLIIRDGGRITGLVGVIPNKIYVGGQTLHAAGIGTVGTTEECRGRGYMSEMMEAALAKMKRENVDVAFLGGNRQRYERFGFTAAGLCAVFELTRKNLTGTRTGVYAFYEMAGCGSEEELALISRLHTRKALYFERSRQKLADILRTWENHVFLITKEGGLCGYLVGKDNGICEIAYENGCALCDILKDYMDHFGKEHLTVYGLGLYEQEKTAELSRCAEDMVLRAPCRTLILNFRNVLSALFELKSRYAKLCDGKLVVRVSAEETSEQIAIEVRDGKASVSLCSGAPDLEIPAPEAARLFCGLGKPFACSGYELPPFAGSWFPLPLNIESADMV